MKVTEKLEALRKLMKEEKLDAYILSNADKHSSEYVNDYYKERSFMSGFDGSAGTVLVTMDKAFLWTDARYFLQAEIDLKDTTIDLMKMGTPGYPTMEEYIKENLSGKWIGLTGEYFSYSFVSAIEKIAHVKTDINLVDKVWTDKEELHTEPIWGLEDSLSGESVESKLNRVRDELKKDDASLFLSNIDDIAWLFNLRGGDVPITPVFLSFAYVSKDMACVFLNQMVLNDFGRKILNDANVSVFDYNGVMDFLKTIKNENVLLPMNQTNYSFVKALEENNKIINKMSPTLLMKAIKNEVEIKNDIDVHIPDGLAVFRYMKYAKENWGKTPMDEFQMAEKVLEYRKMDSRFYEVSFESISSWNSNGAIVHYEPTKESSRPIEGPGFLLLDSGGQYMGGTTDITRTIQLGDVPYEWKHHYTMVLKSHVDVSMAKFLKGATGQNIDMLAREPFWKENLDFKHGTGHGIGYMLNVHEAPNGLRWRIVPERQDSAPIVPGMIQSIEPGIYIAGKYGIRIENEILCVEDKTVDTDQFYKFLTLTVCPYDLDPVIVDELTADERKWINDYHKMCLEKLSKICEKDEIEFLKHMTREI